MRRRALLALVGAASAGCLGRPESGDPPTTSSGPTGGTTTSGTPATTSKAPATDVPELRSGHPSVAALAADCPSRRTATTAADTDQTEGTSTDGAPSVRTPDVAAGVDAPDDEVFLDVEVRRGFTGEHPATMAVVLGNQADESRTFSYGPRPLSHGRHVEGEAAIFADWRDPPNVSLPDGGDCWRAGTELIAEPILMQRELAPGETVTERYVLAAPADGERCLPPGIYRFSTTLTVGDPGRDGDDTALDWALCLR